MRPLLTAFFFLLLIVTVAEAQRGGRLILEYLKPKDPNHEPFYSGLKESKEIDVLVEDLNASLVLPGNITIAFTECGTVNAFYNPSEKRIEMCYELIDYLFKDFSERGGSPEEIERQVANSVVFIFYHELGHALVSELDLPITGKEEDVVDQLATYLILDGTPEGTKAAVDAAVSFYKDPEADEELAFWDVHSLDKQRFYNILCWAYGYDGESLQGLIDEGVLPEERAQSCPEEYELLSKAWTRLLEPHLRKR
ncbi:MAG: DUF4344 domain-containing metallopeptidase [Acidobacteriota bacterium]|nr:DUF4344 domain-containing metallopeptidase [Acidobacteriota bacterium]